MGFLKQLLTGKDNQTHDLARWSMLISLVYLLGLTTWKVYKSAEHVTLIEFAGAVSIITTGHCIGIKAKETSEPNV